ncbi:MAG: TonB-dependent receptor plug domain-containing protein [Steroidobacteraceae bacterium]
MKSRALERLILVTAMGLQPVLAAAQQAELEEVIVTAERREASLQSTPIAVSAVGSEDLERLQITSIKDLDTAVPSMTIETNVASNTSITISMRGNAEQNAAFLFSEPGVGLYLNGVYRRLSGSNIELLDIERIEVLRGPQGTLFGRNTLAGAINVVTRAPSEEFTGSLQLGYGQFDTTRARIAVSGPISGGWSGSASVMRTERAKGWATNLVDNTKLGTNEFLGGTGSLAYEGDKVKALITVYASNAESDGPFGNPVSVATKARLFSDEGFVASAPITVGGRKLMPFNDTDQHGAVRR